MPVVMTLVVAGSRPSGPSPELLAAIEGPLRAGAVRLVVASARPPVDAIAALDGVDWLEIESSEATIPRLRGRALAHAQGRWVAFTEDFCVPAPGWTEALLRRLEDTSAAAVGGPVDRRDGHPRDWALTFVEYGRCLAAPAAGPVERLPEINLAYDLETLQRHFGKRLDEVAPSAIDAALRGAGETFWYEPEMLMIDASARAFWPSCRALFDHGRLWGGGSWRGRSGVLRVARLAATPALALLSLLRIARGAHHARRLGRLMICLPWALALQVCWSLGEAMGTLLGPGASATRWR